MNRIRRALPWAIVMAALLLADLRRFRSEADVLTTARGQATFVGAGAGVEG
jgi:hypothetical protein